MKKLFAAAAFFVFSFLLVGKARAQADTTTYWWNDAVFYEAFVRSFYDSDGDGKGDLQGLTQKLDYIQSLGVNAIWLMPVCPSPSYHGYDISDYKAINADYGTRQDYLNFIDSAHSRGMKVIFDAVMNHTSDQHPWFVKSAANDVNYRSYYRWFKNNPNYNGPWGEQVWYPKNNAYYYGVFAQSMPDLNYTTPGVQDSMFTVVDYWLDSMHVDGFRCDAAPYIIENGSVQENTSKTLQFWADFHTRYTADNPNAMAVGEVWMGDDIIKEYTGGGKFDFCFEFNLGYAIISTMGSGNASDLSNEFNYINTNLPFAQYGTFLTNHDQNRSFDALSNSIPKGKTAAAIYLTLPGVPFVYYGEEIGMTGTGADQLKRTPMQWSADANAGFTTGTPWENLNSNYASYNVAGQDTDSASLLNWYRKLIKVRNATPVIRRGSYTAVTAAHASIFAFTRSYNSSNALVVINTGTHAYTGQQFTLTGITDGPKIVTELLTDTTYNTTITGGQISGINVPAYSAAVYMLTDSVIDVPTGLNTTAQYALAVNVMPNPTNGKILLDIQQPQTGAISITILNEVGQQVYQVSSIAAIHYQQRIDLSNQAAGMYIVELKTATGTVMKKVLVTR